MRAAAFVVMCVLSTLAVAQGGGGGGGGQGQGQGGGQARSRAGDVSCGRELVVVRADGSRERFDSIEAFLKTFPTVELDQGESPRRAVNLDHVLRAYGSDWVDALDCGDHSLQLPGGVPVRYPEYLVLTGRGTLKGIREVSPRRFTNTIQTVRKLTFHKAKQSTTAPR